jgi:hypothetical protein
MPHPYLAFFDKDKDSLDAPQGLAKTQEIVLSVWAGKGERPAFEEKWWKGTLKPVRGSIDVAQLARSQAVGPFWPRDPKRFPQIERMFDEAFGWLDRHIDYWKCYGKFDFGDFRYMAISTSYMTHPGTKWGEMGEMPREGYWHNNERDSLRGILHYYLRSGQPRAWERARAAARHLLDVDIRHFPHFGMHTHGYGHCYAAYGEAGDPDHSWLLGLLEWAGINGDPVAWDWGIRCAQRLASLDWDFSQKDTRTVALHLHILTQFYLYTGERQYLEAASRSAQALLAKQNLDGSWPAYLSKPESAAGFVEHAIMAVADYYQATLDPRFRPVLEKAIQWSLGEGGHSFEPGAFPGETPLALYGVSVWGDIDGGTRAPDLAMRALQKLANGQNLSPDPIGRGDFLGWTEWGVNSPEEGKRVGRPPQFMEQSRPLTPSGVLAYGQRALPMIAKQRKWRLPARLPP